LLRKAANCLAENKKLSKKITKKSKSRKLDDSLSLAEFFGSDDNKELSANISSDVDNEQQSLMEEKEDEAIRKLQLEI